MFEGNIILLSLFGGRVIAEENRSPLFLITLLDCRTARSCPFILEKYPTGVRGCETPAFLGPRSPPERRPSPLRQIQLHEHHPPKV